MCAKIIFSLNVLRWRGQCVLFVWMTERDLIVVPALHWLSIDYQTYGIRKAANVRSGFSFVRLWVACKLLGRGRVPQYGTGSLNLTARGPSERHGIGTEQKSWQDTAQRKETRANLSQFSKERKRKGPWKPGYKRLMLLSVPPSSSTRLHFVGHIIVSKNFIFKN